MLGESHLGQRPGSSCCDNLPGVRGNGSLGGPLVPRDGSSNLVPIFTKLPHRPQPPSSGAAAPRSRLLLRRFAWGGLAHQRGGPTTGGGGSECALARGGGWMGWGGGGVLVVYGPEWVWGRPDCVCVYELCGACTLQSPWGPLRCPLPWGQGCSVVPSSFNTQASKSELHPDTHLWSRVNEADS